MTRSTPPACRRLAGVVPSKSTREDGGFVKHVGVELLVPSSSLRSVKCEVGKLDPEALMKTAASIPVTYSASQ